jgi:hypothetical protein
MKTPAFPLTASICAAALAAAAWVYLSKQDMPAPADLAPSPELPPDSAPLAAAPPAGAPSSPHPDPAPAAPATAPVRPLPPSRTPPPTVPSTAAAAPAKQKRSLQDPAARVALGLVGIDPGAEAYWRDAIFDTTLPESERADLIEDLNEEGLSDTRRPGPDDLPIILRRIALIEELAPRADAFMRPHLREAHKDLQNLARITQGGGEPVK